jgi:hypothetical protein|tara:strand:- start:1309 stop:1989 length:681 start_codon:yes stop_codon:yes gene_type:complete
MNVKQFIHTLLLYGLEYFGVYYSKYECIVVDINDPMKMGRLKVQHPGLFGKDTSDWCFPSGMFAGKDKCLFSLPSIGDIVWLSFKSGNLQYPVWGYGLWAKGELPDEATEDYGNIDIWKTKSGLILQFNNTEETIKFIHPNGLEVEVNKTKIKLGGADHKAVFGDILQPELNKLKTNQDLILSAIQTGITVPQDGGSSYKASMSAIIAGTSSVDFSQINSDTVTLK